MEQTEQSANNCKIVTLNRNNLQTIVKSSLWIFFIRILICNCVSHFKDILLFLYDFWGILKKLITTYLLRDNIEKMFSVS